MVAGRAEERVHLACFADGHLIREDLVPLAVLHAGHDGGSTRGDRAEDAVYFLRSYLCAMLWQHMYTVSTGSLC